MKKNQKETKRNWTIYGNLNDLTIVDIQNKGKEEEIYKRIATVTPYDHHVPNYEESQANAELICKSVNSYEILLNALNRIIEASEQGLNMYANGEIFCFKTLAGYNIEKAKTAIKAIK